MQTPPQADDETTRKEWNDGDGWDELENVLDTADRLAKPLLVYPRTSSAPRSEGAPVLSQQTWVDEAESGAPYLCVEPLRVVVHE